MSSCNIHDRCRPLSGIPFGVVATRLYLSFSILCSCEAELCAGRQRFFEYRGTSWGISTRSSNRGRRTESGRRRVSLSCLVYYTTDHFSIVAVHGLNGHPDKTWTAANGKHWLRDFLPIDIPNARIFCWGYDANTHGDRISCQYLYDHANSLVSDLSLRRRLTNVGFAIREKHGWWMLTLVDDSAADHLRGSQSRRDYCQERQRHFPAPTF